MRNTDTKRRSKARKRTSLVHATSSFGMLFRRALGVRAGVVRWFGRLGAELDRSPLNQLMFFVGIAGTVFGLISGWSHLISFMRMSWPALSAAFAIALLFIHVTRRIARSRMLREENNVLSLARSTLLKTLRAGTRLTSSEAVELLRDIAGAESEQVLNELINMGHLTRSFDDYIREERRQ